MIKINLATRRQAEIVSDGSRSSKSFGSFLGGIDLDAAKDLPIRKVMLPLIVGVAASYMLDSYKEDELNKIQRLIEKQAADGKKLQAEVAKFKGYEGIKKALDEDEVTIRSKLETIQKLTETRGESVKMLGLLSTSIPKDVWLTEYRIEKSDISLKGSTVDFNQISDFMKNLRDSTRFTDVELKDSQQQKEQVGGRVASVFELKAIWR
jgi:Tfp pilus assembly protein PilN